MELVTLDMNIKLQGFKCPETCQVNTEVWIAIEENWSVMYIGIDYG